MIDIRAALYARVSSEHQATAQTIASQMTRTADEILYRFGARSAPGDLAPR